VLAQVEQPEPERNEAADRVGVVAALVTPLFVSWMRRGPVKFHAHPVFLVEIIEINVSGALPYPGLATSDGQAVRALHAVDVAIFQHGQDAAFGVAQRERDLPAPAHLLARSHGNSDPISSSASTADGSADPCVCVVEGPRDLDEVKHRIFDSGAGREHRRVPGPQDRI